MPKLLLKFDAAFLKEIKLDKPVFTVGRKPDNDIVLDHPTVSGHHCKVYSAGAAWFVEDLNSTNGTAVNDKRVLKAGLRHNDAIVIVKFSLVFYDDGAPPPVSAPEAGRARQSEPAPAPQQPAAPVPQIAPAPQKTGPKGCLEVLANPVGSAKEFEISGLSTYIGKSAQANIPYKAGGLFGSGPDIAAVISMRPDGYYLTPIKEGYARHNGDPLNDRLLLKDDDILEVGVTKFRFFLKK